MITFKNTDFDSSWRKIYSELSKHGDAITLESAKSLAKTFYRLGSEEEMRNNVKLKEELNSVTGKLDRIKNEVTDANDWDGPMMGFSSMED